MCVEDECDAGCPRPGGAAREVWHGMMQWGPGTHLTVRLGGKGAGPVREDLLLQGLVVVDLTVHGHDDILGVVEQGLHPQVMER